MRITDYFMPRSTKVIDNQIIPLCSLHHSVSLESTTTIPASQATPLLVSKTTEDNNSSSRFSLF